MKAIRMLFIDTRSRNITILYRIMHECIIHQNAVNRLLLFGKICHSDSEGRWFESSRAYIRETLQSQWLRGFLLL